MRARDGREFGGVNVENAAYPLGVCAERSAIAAAVAAGCRPGDLEAIGITAAPCGGCRQWLHEFRIGAVSYRAEDGTLRTRLSGRAAARRLGAARVRSGFVALTGRPNVGKSTLVNALTGQKVAIVSAVPHTTRHRIRGVWTRADAQLVLVDLPGWQKPIDPLTERMQRRVEEAIGDDPDVVVLVVNARERIGAGDRYVARRVFALGVPVVIALNKVDRLKPGAHRLPDAERRGSSETSTPSTRSAPGSARASTSCVPTSSRSCPRGPAYYPAGEVTDMPLETRIAELVREQALALIREEVPHALTAELVEIDERRVHVRLYTETESQKQIMIGKGGSMVREIGRKARPGIEALLGHEIYLELQVRASPRWRRNETMLERLGL